MGVTYHLPMFSMTYHKHIASQRFIYQASALVIAILYGTIYLGLPGKWWYEDDPVIFSYAKDVNNPIDFFIDPDILHHIATGVSAVPMWLLSYWIDSHLFSLSPSVAYLHNVTSFAIISILLLTTTNRYIEDLQTSFLLTVIWMLLPSTISVLYFLSARHYLEGLGWGLLACFFLPDLCNESIRLKKKLVLYLMTGLSLCAALLSKEVYVPTLLVFFFLYGAAKKNLFLTTITVSAAISYWHYRSLVVGSTNTYPVPLLIADYANYLSTIPYTLTLSHAGYLAYLVFAACIVMAVGQDNHALNKSLWLVTLVFMAGIISVYPTAFAVLQTYKTPGTWYRSSFIINTLFIIFYCWLLAKATPRNTRIIALFFMVVFVASGNITARSYWNERHLRSETEGRFYLDNPDKLLYSEEDAYWFIPGIESLYNVKQTHYIDKINITSDHSKKMLAAYPSIWRYRDGTYARSEELYNYIKSKNE